ncbi:tripartite motif-containing protein 2-like [Saccostrea echinata]|uniref:tripartite motif-containing protein 2-like n=1 Tax=Saccostrea echinata TaxID=191078 RepID=UPI002A7EFEFA|nr:tripartite motif-containing protein 2-like [Saccostrea echinata]
MQISCMSSDLVWISDLRDNSLILTNTKDNKDYIRKLSKDNRRSSIFMKQTETWKPRCVFCSHLNGDILVGTATGKVNRFNSTGQHIQTIQYNNKGGRLFKTPRYITENHNGDVIVSDFLDYIQGAVVVTERGGKYRFSYTGPSSSSRLDPRGICTDAMSHILICDWITSTVHILDKDGTFLSQIHTQQQQSICKPRCLSYNDNTHLLWVGSDDNRVCIYKYINRQDCGTVSVMKWGHKVMYYRPLLALGQWENSRVCGTKKEELKILQKTKKTKNKIMFNPASYT